MSYSLRETEQKLRETEQKLRETEQKLRETEQKLSETEQKLSETEKTPELTIEELEEIERFETMLDKMLFLRRYLKDDDWCREGAKHSKDQIITIVKLKKAGFDDTHAVFWCEAGQEKIEL